MAIPAGVISTSDFVSSIAREEKPLRQTVADVMSDAILVCRDKTPLTSAARTMTQAGWRSVLVVDAKGKPEGVVSGKDLLPYVENGVDEKLTVRDIMHPALTIDIHAKLARSCRFDDSKTLPSPGGDRPGRSAGFPAGYYFILRYCR